MKDWQIYRHGDDVSVVFVNPKPWWKVWEPGEFVRTFGRQDLIVFYQSLATAAIPAMTRDTRTPTDLEQVRYDLQQAVTVSRQDYGLPPLTTSEDRGVIDGIAALLHQKGYRKL